MVRKATGWTRQNKLMNVGDTLLGKVIPFKRPAIKKLGMCQHGFHDWVIDKKRKFEVRQGKLVTRYVCSRCGLEKVKGH